MIYVCVQSKNKFDVLVEFLWLCFLSLSTNESPSFLTALTVGLVTNAAIGSWLIIINKV